MAAAVPLRGGEPAIGPELGGSGKNGGFSPGDLRSAYALPSTGGGDQTIAITIAYDNPKAEADLATYRSDYGLPPCTTANGCFRKVNQTGEAKNYPAADANWALETSLDLDMASAICPQCDILLVEADSNYLEDLGAAVETAVDMGATVVSNSWATQEFSGEEAQDHYFDHPGIPVLFASGDWGYGVYYPAASPDVVAVGGTSLFKDGNPRGWQESAWSGAGSGCSAYEVKPAWQKDDGCGGRTVADVSAVADPSTPVSVYDSFEQSGWVLLGGTSVATPVLAGVEALSSSSFRAMGPAAFDRAGNGGETFDVSEGENGPCGAVSESGFGATYLCQADVGYDGPTGWGTPDGPFALPVAITEAAKRVSDDQVVLHGAVDPTGLETEYHFEYGKTTSYGTNVPLPDADLGKGSGYVEVSQSVAGLEGQTPYHYRIVATNTAGTFTGEDRVIGTTPPAVVTGAAAEVTASKASLAAEVNPEGLGTTYYFEYGPNTSYGFKAPTRAGEAGAGTEAVEVSGSLAGLASNRIYHYRVVAKNVAGVTYGTDKSFTTAPSKWWAEDLPQPPNSGNGHWAKGISCPAPDECVAVGANWDLAVHTRATLAESWNGTSWSVMDTPDPPGLDDGWMHDWYALLNDVSCVSLTACVAVGQYRDPSEVVKPLAEVWDGDEWTMSTLPWPAGAASARLSGVSCASATDCVAVGRFETASGTAKVLALRWNGSTWAPQSMPIPAAATDSWLASASCFSSSACTVVGGYETGTGAIATLAVRWDGGSWTIQPTLSPGPRSEAQLRDVACAASTACMAVGYFRAGPTLVALAERWDGGEWIDQSPSTPEEEGALASVSCATPTNCTAVGSYYGRSETDHGWRPLVPRWDGTAWSLLETVAFSAPPGGWHEEIPWGVACPEPEACTMVGERLVAGAGEMAVPTAFAEHEGEGGEPPEEEEEEEVWPPEDENQPPEASFSMTPGELFSGQLAAFNASSSNDSDGVIESYSWKFGDGTIGTGVKVSHAYSKVGKYIAMLTVTDDDGATDTAWIQVNVSEAPIPDPEEKAPELRPEPPRSEPLPPLAPSFAVQQVRAGRHGKVIMLLRTEGAGRLSADARFGLAQRYGSGSVNADGDGLFRLVIAPRPDALRALRDRIRIRLQITTVFRPVQGAPTSKSRVFAFRR